MKSISFWVAIAGNLIRPLDHIESWLVLSFPVVVTACSGCNHGLVVVSLVVVVLVATATVAPAVVHGDALVLVHVLVLPHVVVDDDDVLPHVVFAVHGDDDDDDSDGIDAGGFLLPRSVPFLL